MALLSAVTTWSAGDKLTASALNGEFENILDALNGSDNDNIKTIYNAADLPTVQLVNSHASGYALQAGDGTNNDLFGVKGTGVIESKVTTGTAPLIVASTTLVSNLNADLLDGAEGSAYALLASSPTFTAPASTGTIKILDNHPSTDELRLRVDSANDLAGLYLYDGVLATERTMLEYYSTTDYMTFTGAGLNPTFKISGTTGAYLEIEDSNSNSSWYFSASGGLCYIKAWDGSVYEDFVTVTPGSDQWTFEDDIEVKIDGNLRIHGNNEATLTAYTTSGGLSPDMRVSSCFRYTLNGNATMSDLSYANTGATYIIIVKQDGTGGRTLAWGTKFKFSGGTAPTLTATAGATDIFTIFVENSSTYHVTSVQNMS